MNPSLFRFDNYPQVKNVISKVTSKNIKCENYIYLRWRYEKEALKKVLIRVVRVIKRGKRILAAFWQ